MVGQQSYGMTRRRLNLYGIKLQFPWRGFGFFFFGIGIGYYTAALECAIDNEMR
jgi:hypothetical protein